MRKLTISLILFTVGIVAFTGCSKSTAPAAPAAEPTVIRGTVTDSLGNPLDSVAIKVKYSFTPVVKASAKAPQDSVSNFTALVVASGIRLDWRTESETDCYYWTIERSLQVDTGFTSIATVPGHGTTSTPQDYSYTDTTVTGGNSYYYRLCSVDLSGFKTYYGPVSTGPLAVSADGFPGCTPIPVIGSAQLVFKLAGNSHAELSITRNGATVRSLIDAAMNSGSHAAVWNGNNNAAIPVPTGFYHAAFVLTRHDSVKTYTQPVFVNFADSSSPRANASSNPQGAFSCTDMPVDSIFFMKGPAGEELGSVKVAASVTIYACKPGYPVMAKNVVLTKNASNTVNFILK
jgi:hypothetical protein